MIRGALLLLLAWGPPALAAMEPADAAPIDAAPVAAGDEPAPDAETQLAAASVRVAAAGKVLDAARATPDAIPALADAVGGYEAALAALRAGAAAAAAEREALEADMAARSGATARVLGTMAAMSRTPPPDDGLHPQGPLGAARASAVMQRLSPALAAEAQAIAARAVALAAAQAQEQAAAVALTEATATLHGAQTALAAALVASAPDPNAAADSPALTVLARESESLSALAAALARTEGTPPPPATAAAEPLLWPVSGELLRGFNQPDAAGVRRPGLDLVAPPLALVRAPADAVVRYAGPFLEYGYVVVLEPARETLLVLAGIAQLRVRAGAAVERGDLLGLLGGRPPDVEETVMPGAGTGAGVSETLYIEVRHGRGPVDPQPLFAAKDG